MQGKKEISFLFVDKLSTIVTIVDTKTGHFLVRLGGKRLLQVEFDLMTAGLHGDLDHLPLRGTLSVLALEDRVRAPLLHPSTPHPSDHAPPRRDEILPGPSAPQNTNT